ncbi:MAG: endonuclease/exonuclease/phosphatase family protein [Coraliomargaritaceae bacterium]
MTQGIASLLFTSCAIFPLAAESLRIATYNLHNYLPADRLVDGRWRPDYPKPEQEKRALRKDILSVRPDVLVVQEIGTVEHLEELKSDLSAGGLSLPFAAWMPSVDGLRNMAVLSRLPIRSVVRHDDLDFRYFDQSKPVKRGLLEVDLSLSGRAPSSLRLFVVHLKSKYSEEAKDPDSRKRRLGEAEACRTRIIERTMEDDIALYCITGDFNDHPKSSTVRRFLQRGDRILGYPVPAQDERGEVWTHFYARRAQYSTIDGFVSSPELFSRIVGGQGKISPESIGSDHRMVYLDIEFVQ